MVNSCPPSFMSPVIVLFNATCFMGTEQLMMGLFRMYLHLVPGSCFLTGMYSISALKSGKINSKDTSIKNNIQIALKNI